MVVSQNSYEIRTSNGNTLQSIVTEVKDSDRIVMVVPGAGASVSGEFEGDKRYNQLTRVMSAEVGHAVVRFSNTFREDYGFFDEEPNIMAMLQHAESIADGRAVTGFGFSAGCRMLAQAGHNLEAMDNLILINPDGGLTPDLAIEGIKKFIGRTKIIVGSDDITERQDFAKELFEVGSSDQKAIMHLPNVDHMFTNRAETFTSLARQTIVSSSTTQTD